MENEEMIDSLSQERVVEEVVNQEEDLGSDVLTSQVSEEAIKTHFPFPTGYLCEAVLPFF